MFFILSWAAVTYATNYAVVTDEDRWRFPFSREQAMKGWLIAGTHLYALNDRTSNAHAEEIPFIMAWRADVKRRHRCWDILDYLRRIHPDDEPKNRVKLAELRSLIGPEWYWRGFMPDYSPAYLFRPRTEKP